MVAEDGPQLEPPGLRGARADFAARLSRRLAALRRLVTALEQSPDSSFHSAQLKTSFRSLAAAATVLGFERVAGGLEQAERLLEQVTPERPLRAEDVVLLRRLLGRIPSLGWDAPVSLPESRQGAQLSVLACVPPSLGSALEAVDPGLLLEIVSTAAELQFLPPGADAVLIDADLPGAAETIAWLLRAERGPAPPLVVVGSDPEPEAMARLVARGAGRVVSKPSSPQSLARLLRELGRNRAPAAAVEPLGELTVPELSHRLAAEVRRRLVDGMDQDGATTRVALGDGADVLGAVWSAVARVQNAVTLRSGGAVRFDPLAAGGGQLPDGPDAGSPAAGAVELAGRRAVVADDDPALVWFLASLLTSHGVEVLEAHDGRRAFDLVAAAWPDFVLSDVLMPELDGCGLCREIKRDVAVRDVPVLLFSWKEDLLEHLRELGVGADAYLTKGASADAILHHIRQALRPRARWEQQLDAGGEVSGHLDGLTPRLLLSLVASRGLDAQVRLQDATFLYEAELRQGRLRSVTRSSTRGSFERGREALARLLGMSAGRFAIVPSATPCCTEFAGSLPEVLAPHIAAARAAVRAVSAESLLRVERLVLDEAAVAVELGGLPGPAVELLEQIRRGAGPRELCTAGSTRMLEAVLGTLARRGAVLGVYGPDGEDLLGPGSDAMDRDAHDSCASETPSVSFNFDLTLPAAEPSVPMLVIESPLMPRAATPPAELAAVVPWEEEEADRFDLVPDSSEESSPTPAPAEDEPLPASLELPVPDGCERADAGAESSGLVLSLAGDACRASYEPSVDPEEHGHAADVSWESEDPDGGRCTVTMPAAPGGETLCAVDWWVDTEAVSGEEVVASLVHTVPWPNGRRGVVADGDTGSLVDEIDLGWDDLILVAELARAEKEVVPERQHPEIAETAADREPAEVRDEADVQLADDVEGSAEPARAVAGQEAMPEGEVLADPEPASNPEIAETAADREPAEVRGEADVQLADDVEGSAEPARAFEVESDGECGVLAEPESASSAESAETSADREVDAVEADEQAGHEPDFRSADFDWDEVVVSEVPAPALPAGDGVSREPEPPAASEPDLVGSDEEVGLPGDESPDLAEIVVSSHPALPTGDLQELFLFATQPPPTVSAPAAEPPAMPETKALPVRKITLPARFTKSPHSPSHARPSVPDSASAREATAPLDEATPLEGEVSVSRRNAGGWLGIARTVLVTGLAAAVSFGVVRWWVAPRAQSSASGSVSSAGDPVALAAPVGSLHVVKAKSVSEQARVQEGALPAGTALPPGKGLLEVSTGDRHAIHVDDAFVGLGPVRPVVVDPGQHQVRVRLDGVDKSFPVSVASARLVRLDVVAP